MHNKNKITIRLQQLLTKPFCKIQNRRGGKPFRQSKQQLASPKTNSDRFLTAVIKHLPYLYIIAGLVILCILSATLRWQKKKKRRKHNKELISSRLENALKANKKAKDLGKK